MGEDNARATLGKGEGEGNTTAKLAKGEGDCNARATLAKRPFVVNPTFVKFDQN